MTVQRIDKAVTIQTQHLIELRGASGRLYGMLDRDKLIIEVKRKGEPAERIDLRPYLEATKP